MTLDKSSKFYSRSLTLLIYILEMVSEHSSQAQIAETLDLNKSHISYYIKKAIRIGYVKEICRDRLKILDLTQKGINFIDQYKNRTSIKQQLPRCRAENVRLKACVYKLPRKSLDWHKIEMNNWSQYNSVIDDIRVHLNVAKTSNIEFIPSPIDGSDPWNLLGILFNDCNEVARKLEQTLDMEIGRLEIEHGAEWVVYDPVANLISKQNGQITIDGLGKINASKPLRRGEIEYFDPRFAADYITMPKRISNIEKLLEDLLRKEGK
ncbi:MAG: helix-turn-helix domain-containing protein [Haloechinothrix sp.]